MNEPPSCAYDVFCRLANTVLPNRHVLEQATQTCQLQPDEPLFLAGEKRNFVYVVSQGIIKMVYETTNGDAWIKGFATTGLCFASLTALEVNGLTSFSAYAETATCVDQIDFASLQSLANDHPAWQLAISNAYKIYGQRKEQREMEMLTLSAAERYLNFLQQHPELVKILKQRDVASYVRVTPVALSRIKSRLQNP